MLNEMCMHHINKHTQKNNPFLSATLTRRSCLLACLVHVGPNLWIVIAYGFAHAHESLHGQAHRLTDPSDGAKRALRLHMRRGRRRSGTAAMLGEGGHLCAYLWSVRQEINIRIGAIN